MVDNKVLSIDSLSVKFNTKNISFKAVQDVSFSVEKGEILGIVGESGSGKSVTSLAIMGLLPKGISEVTSGEISYFEKDLLNMRSNEKRNLRGNEISMIFQEPMTSLNPVFTIGDQIGRVIKNHKRTLTKKEREKRVIELLNQVGIPRSKEIVDEYPHQLSGGMRQRIMIAMAIACDPKILIADEPTTALDVTIQAQILQLIKGFAKNRDMSLVLITHDLGVVAEMCDRVIVMYSGRIVEKATKEEFFNSPKHPYSQALLKSIPKLGDKGKTLAYIKGNVPPPNEKIKGCRFKTRCDFAFSKCEIEPDLFNYNNRSCRCWLVEEEGL